MKMKNNLVISRYNEDLDWVKFVDKNKYKIFIYNKGSKIENLDTIDLPNYGRESQTYIHHIIQNYHNLSDYTVFLQGNPFDHDGNLQNFGYRNLLDYINHYNFDRDIISIGSIHSDLGYINEKQNITTELNINSGVNFFSVGPQFIIHKKNILNKPISFWKTLNEWSSPDNGKWCHITLPYILERLWINIFNSDLK